MNSLALMKLFDFILFSFNSAALLFRNLNVVAIFRRKEFPPCVES